VGFLEDDLSVKALVNCQLHNNQRRNLMVRKQLGSALHATAKEK